MRGHQLQLLSSGRCGWCAEQVGRARVLRQEACPRCDRRLAVEGARVTDALEARRLGWRFVGYAMVGAASFLAGAVPLLQFVVQLGALFILHVWVLRRALRWLAPARRVLARVTIKLMGGALAAVALLLNVAIAPLLGISALILGVSGPILTAIYVELALMMVRKRMDWEAQAKPVGPAEWALPAGLAALLLGLIVGLVAVVMSLTHLIASADLPSIREITTALMEFAP